MAVRQERFRKVTEKRIFKKAKSAKEIFGICKSLFQNETTYFKIQLST